MSRIAILGAGLSGLTVARALVDAGHEVEVFEKSRGTSGRMSTKRLPWSHLDIGAQYFTARTPEFTQTVSSWEKEGWIKPWQFTPHALRDNTLVLSPDETERWVGTPDMSSLCRGLAVALPIHFNRRIRSAARTANAWTLHTDQGEALGPYDALVSSIPAEQARQVIEHPCLSALPEHIHHPCWALGLATTGAVDETIEGVFGDDTVRWVSRLNRKPGRETPIGIDDLWMLHFGPDISAGWDRQAENDVVSCGAQWLRTLLGEHLEIQHHATHFWRFANPQAERSGPPCYWDATTQLGVIGAWCLDGRVESAYVSALSWLDATEFVSV